MSAWSRAGAGAPWLAANSCQWEPKHDLLFDTTYYWALPWSTMHDALTGRVHRLQLTGPPGPVTSM